MNIEILEKWRPNVQSVKYYKTEWENLKGYQVQEKALEKLFGIQCPKNNDLSDILIKCSVLNEFYSTNVYYINDLAKHIENLNIDTRLMNGDITLVNEIAKVPGRPRYYSFATKYCSHHFPTLYPIYDNNVELVLKYFRKKDEFVSFKNEDLKDYSKFVEIINAFRIKYELTQFNYKELDIYLWQLGKKAAEK
ncbi:MAG: hypothetical protein Q4E68_07395 [Prevotellaceae bacterium]|nr:hypothetical protein [Prevotellaceae bacterium]